MPLGWRMSMCTPYHVAALQTGYFNRVLWTDMMVDQITSTLHIKGKCKLDPALCADAVPLKISAISCLPILQVQTVRALLTSNSTH